MKRLAAVGVLALALTCKVAFAEKDKASGQGQPAPSPWTGFNVGLDSGFAWDPELTVNNRDLIFPSNVVPLIDPGLDFRPGGFAGGVFLGYDWQVARLLVVGVEGDFSGTTLKANDSSTLPLLPPNEAELSFGRVQSKLPWFATIRGRIGLAVDDVLVYATAGAAVAQIDASWSQFTPVVVTGLAPAALVASDDSAHWGIAVGAGVEYMLTPNWIFRGEFLYMDFGAQSFNVACLSFSMVGGCTAPPNFPSTFAGRFSSAATAAIARVGVEYKFNWGPAPVVAKY